VCEDMEARDRRCERGVKWRGAAKAARDAARMARVVGPLDAIVDWEAGGCELLSPESLMIVF
jgi:hypothetical protein